MTLEMRSISLRTRPFQPTTSLNASAMSPSIPSQFVGSFTEKSPRATARSAFRSWRFALSDAAVLRAADAPLRAIGAPLVAVRFPLVFGFPATAAGGIRDLLGSERMDA